MCQLSSLVTEGQHALNRSVLHVVELCLHNTVAPHDKLHIILLTLGQAMQLRFSSKSSPVIPRVVLKKAMLLVRYLRCR